MPRVGGNPGVSRKWQQGYPLFPCGLLWLPSLEALEDRRLWTGLGEGGDCCQMDHLFLDDLGKSFTLPGLHLHRGLAGRRQMLANCVAQCKCSVVSDCHHQSVLHDGVSVALEQCTVHICSINIWWVNEIIHYSIKQWLIVSVFKNLMTSGRALLLSSRPSLWAWAWVQYK